MKQTLSEYFRPIRRNASPALSSSYGKAPQPRIADARIDAEFTVRVVNNPPWVTKNILRLANKTVNHESCPCRL